MSNDDVWVVVPVFNEAPVVREVLAGVRQHFPNVVAVDDGSSDNSLDAIIAGGAKAVRHPLNLGMGAALQTGLQFALHDPRARYFVMFDADGQHRVEDAIAMIRRLRGGDIDVLLGSRFLGGPASMPASRRALLKAARAFERATTGLKLTDAHCGLRAFTRRFAERVDLRFADMAHASELLVQLKRSGLKWAEHPVTVDYTDYSVAKGQRSINSINIAADIWLHHLLRGERP